MNMPETTSPWQKKTPFGEQLPNVVLAMNVIIRKITKFHEKRRTRQPKWCHYEGNMHTLSAGA